MSRLRACRLVLVSAAVLVAGADRSSSQTPPQITITDLGGLSGYTTTARGINDAGEIVGEMFRTINENAFESHGLIWRMNASRQYSATEIGELPNLSNSYPRSINGAGRIAGYVEPASLLDGDPPQVAMWEPDASGNYLPVGLGEPFFQYSQTANFADGGHVLNELGQIVGSAVLLPSGQHHAHLWDDPGLSAPIDLSPAAADGTEFSAYGVDNAGLVVGRESGFRPSDPGAPRIRFENAILWQGAGEYSQLKTVPVDARATAFDINDSGQIVGVVSGLAVIWEWAEATGYEPTYLTPPPGATFCRANAISNAGEVIGSAQVSGSGSHAVLWQEDSSGQYVPTDLGRGVAYGINERGQIVGSAPYADGVTHAVLWELGVDTTPPTITNVSASPGLLWPPNHKMIDVAVSYDAVDDSGSVTCGLSPVICNEPVTPADWQVVDSSTVQLRSERYGSGNGRIYTISITCRDEAGNTATQSLFVTVPHDRRR